MPGSCAHIAHRSQLRSGYAKLGHRFYFYLKGDGSRGVGADLPLSLREQKPHEDTDRHGECAVHEAGLDIKCEEHRRGSVATKDQLGISTKESGIIRPDVPACNTHDRVGKESDGASLDCGILVTRTGADLQVNLPRRMAEGSSAE
jgi:hypothetical protein